MSTKKFITFLYMAEAIGGATAAVETKATPAPKPELTSPKLVELKAAMKAAWKSQNAFEDPFDPKAKDAKLAFLKAEGEVKAEILSLEKASKDAEIAEQRNLRIALNRAQFTAYDAMLAVNADKKATQEQKDAAKSAFETAREQVENELLAKFAGSKPASSSSNGDAVGRQTESKAAILEMYHAGKSHKEIEEAGYPASTVWHTINNWKKANGTK